jgi:hypothetical protein
MSKKKERKRYVDNLLDKETIGGWKILFHLSREMMEECTDCYIKKQYMGSVLLAYAFIEQSISQVFKADIVKQEEDKKEQKSLKYYTVSFSEKLEIARLNGDLTHDEVTGMKEQYKSIRNAYTHDTDKIRGTGLINNKLKRKETAELAISYVSLIVEKFNMVFLRHPNPKTPKKRKKGKR